MTAEMTAVSPIPEELKETIVDFVSPPGGN